MRGRLSIVSFGSFLCVGWRRAEGHGDWKPVRLTPSCRRTSRLREVSLRHELTVPSVKAGNQVASFSVAVPVPSLSAAGCRFTFAVATPVPRGAVGGVVHLGAVGWHASAHCEGRVRPGLRRSLAARSGRLLSFAVLVPSLSHRRVGRLALAGAGSFGRSGAAVSAMASGLVPSVAMPATLRAARSRSQQPNPAVERTLREKPRRPVTSTTRASRVESTVGFRRCSF